MKQVIIYLNSNNTLAIIVPSPECLMQYSIDLIAKKDVPPNSPYKIINADELPTDMTFRSAWYVDKEILTDGLGSKYYSFEEILNDQNQS